MVAPMAETAGIALNAEKAAWERQDDAMESPIPVANSEPAGVLWLGRTTRASEKSGNGKADM